MAYLATSVYAWGLVKVALEIQDSIPPATPKEEEKKIEGDVKVLSYQKGRMFGTFLLIAGWAIFFKPFLLDKNNKFNYNEILTKEYWLSPSKHVKITQI